MTARVLPAHPDRWTRSPEFMVRVAGLPIEVLDGLRCPSTMRWADEVIRAEASVRTLAEELCDRLGAAVAGLEDAGARRDLLRLRRDVHNLRQPSDAALTLAHTHAPTAVPMLARWLTARQDLDDLRTRGDGVLQGERAESQLMLRRQLAEPRLRAGLLLAAPTLEAQLDPYLDPHRTVDAKRTRKIERSAVSYVYRTATKPSPFSTFTGVALGQFHPRPHHDLHPHGGPDTQEVPERWTSNVRLNVVALSRLADAVLGDPARRADLRVVPASGWGQDADRVRYVRRSLRAGDAAAAMTLDSARDQLFFLRRSDILEDMLTVVSRTPAPLYREVAAWLADRLDAEPGDCDHYLGDLLDLGLLQVPLLATAVHSADPLGEFHASLLDLGRPWATELAHALDGPRTCLAAYPQASPERRRSLLAELREGLVGALESLGGAASALPSTLVYEDVRVAEEPLACDEAAWRGLVDEPLRALERMLPAFDETLRHRQTLRAFFLARFGPGGRCEDLLGLVHDFHEDIYEEYQSYVARTPRVDDHGRLTRDPNWLGDPGITALDSARALFAQRLTELVADQPDAVEIELGRQVVDAVSQAVGEALGGVGAGFTATTHFLQRAEDVVVHNSAYGGLSFPFSRFTHWLGDDLSERLHTRAREHAPSEAVFAEVTGGSATSNLNLHTRITDHEIVCPGEDTSAPEESRIPLTSLVLEHDLATDRLVLRSRRLGCEVVPIYLGYLVPYALPAISRTLLLLSPSATYRLDPWAGVPCATVRDGVEHRPRLRLGTLVLSRRSWTASVGDLPGPGQGADELLRWQRWRRAHDVPERVFARVRTAPASAPGRRPKPQLVDFGSALSLESFRAALTDADARVELTEMLPGPDSLHVHSRAGSHAAELTVETVAHRLPVVHRTPIPAPRRAQP